MVAFPDVCCIGSSAVTVWLASVDLVTHTMPAQRHAPVTQRGGVDRSRVTPAPEDVWFSSFDVQHCNPERGSLSFSGIPSAGRSRRRGIISVSRKVRAPWTGCQVTPGHQGWSLPGDGQCHRKQTALAQAWVRVKRWGKSPPRAWKHGRHGKPQLEQGRISGEQQSSATQTPRVGR